jgi:hypothetical protein
MEHSTLLERHFPTPTPPLSTNTFHANLIARRRFNQQARYSLSSSSAVDCGRIAFDNLIKRGKQAS